MNTLRWRFTDTETDEQWTVPINPNTSTDPNARPKSLRFATPSPTNATPGSRPVSRGIESAPTPVEWEFGGVINTQDHHDQLEAWKERDSLIHIRDHFGDSYEVLIRTFEPTERQPTARNPARFTYLMRATVLRRVS